jgi:uncharacterized membrane protein YeaQ/YmgE (transglycosylase-associated protein family)
MSSIIVDLIINAIGKSLPKYDLGLIGNTIAGGIGGVAGGQVSHKYWGISQARD